MEELAKKIAIKFDKKKNKSKWNIIFCVIDRRDNRLVSTLKLEKRLSTAITTPFDELFCILVQVLCTKYKSFPAFI